MHTTTTTYLSRKGFKELRKAIHQLERRLNKAMQELRELDKTETREDRLIRIEKLSAIESIEANLEEKRLQLAVALPYPRKRDALKVAIGSVVELIDEQGRLLRYTIVDSIEANPSDGRISILSPLGRNLIGKTVHDTIEWTSNKFQTNSMQLVRVI
ncbi:MAG: GreA/GreB family elongation factor [Candidatus Saccharimonadales bacterium]